jgi:hypothetical protein
MHSWLSYRRSDYAEFRRGPLPTQLPLTGQYSA